MVVRLILSPGRSRFVKNGLINVEFIELLKPTISISSGLLHFKYVWHLWPVKSYLARKAELGHSYD